MPESADERLAKLLSGAIENDDLAWNRLVLEFAPFMHAVCHRLFQRYNFTFSRQDEEDVVSETWRNLLANDHRLLHRCLEKGGFFQTVHVLIRNRTVDFIRSHRMKVDPLPDEPALLDTPPAPPPPPKPDDGEIESALKTLTDREQNVIRLFFLHDKKYREIADLTGMPQNSIGPTLARALTKLRKVITRA